MSASGLYWSQSQSYHFSHFAFYCQCVILPSMTRLTCAMLKPGNSPSRIKSSRFSLCACGWGCWYTVCGSSVHLGLKIGIEDEGEDKEFELVINEDLQESGEISDT